MTDRPTGEAVVFLDRPGYRVTSALVLIGGQPIETCRVYTAAAGESPRGWVARLLRWPPRYELRMLTADGSIAVPIGADSSLAEELAAAINRAVAPGHWMR